MEERTIIIGDRVYVDGDPIPNYYNGTIVYPSWTDSKSFISPNMTLKETIVRNLKMHAVGILRSNTPHGVTKSIQIVEANWTAWRQLFC